LLNIGILTIMPELTGHCEDASQSVFEFHPRLQF